MQGEAANATLGLREELLAKDPYQLDDKFIQKGFVLYIEGKKGEQGKEWGATQTPKDYAALDVESEKRAHAFMTKSVADGKPFYLAWWPLWTSFLPDPKKVSLQRGLVGEAYQKNLDPAVGRLVDFLRAQGLAENTLIVAMSDNGPMVHNPPPNAGLGEGIFRGGKGDSTEGGVRVCRRGLVAGHDQARADRPPILSTSPISIRPSPGSGARPSICRPTGSSTGWTRRRCC